MSGIRRRAIHKRLVEERNQALGYVESTRTLYNVGQQALMLAIGERDALQAKVDALMLEYCPDEMTPEQTKRWQDNQSLVIPRFVMNPQAELALDQPTG